MDILDLKSQFLRIKHYGSIILTGIGFFFIIYRFYCLLWTTLWFLNEV